MAYAVRTLARWPDLRSSFRRFHAQGWPDFLQNDELNARFSLIYERFPAFQFGLCDRRGRVVAIGNSVPFVWDGARDTLPDRIVDVINTALRAQEHRRRPTALSALAAIVDPRLRGRDLSRRVIAVMGRIAAAHRLRALVAPVRPMLKGHYPLTPMATYVEWRRADGALFDPWLRVHRRLGARVVQIARRAMTVTTTVAQWEERTGLTFPASGKRDRGRYVEPNVWMRHPVRRTAPSARR